MDRERNLVSPEFDHRTVQSVAGSYIECTTLALLTIWCLNITVMCTVSCTVGHADSIIIIVVVLI